jgi:chaperonin GroEL
MSAGQVLFQSAAREKVLRGAAQLADAVRITLGPKSNLSIISFGSHTFRIAGGRYERRKDL